MNLEHRDSLLSGSSADLGPRPAEAHGGPDSPVADSIYECLKKGLDINPDQVAFIAMHQATEHLADTISSTGPVDVECLHWTYRQINEASLKLAIYLVEVCPPERRRLACFVWNSIEYAILYWAVAHIRGTFVPLDPTVLECGREESRDWYLTSLKPDIVVALNYSDGLESLISTALPQSVRISVADAETLPPSWRSLSSVLRDTHVASPLGTIPHTGLPDPAAPVQVLFTSGTTANPKPMAHSAAKVTPCVYNVSHTFPPGLLLLATTANFRPMYMFSMMAAHFTGAALLVPHAYFTPSTAVTAITKYQPYLGSFVPATMRLVINEASSAGVELSSIRAINMGGDVITKNMIDIGRKGFPNATIRTLWGLTETSTNTYWPTVPDPLPSVANNVVSSGTPMAGFVLRICAPGTLNLLKRGEAGELWVAGQGVLDAYADGRDPELFRTGLDLKGMERRWFCTGDIAMLDEQDHLYVLGRYKDIIVRAGINLSPVAMETVLNKLGCRDVNVVGLPHKLLGSAPVAVTRSLEGMDAKHLVEGVERMLGKDYRLEHIWTLQDLGLDEWIYNSTGKVSKKDLQQTLLETVVSGSL